MRSKKTITQHNKYRRVQEQTEKEKMSKRNGRAPREKKTGQIYIQEKNIERGEKTESETKPGVKIEVESTFS